MFYPVTPKIYNFDNEQVVKERDFLSCKSFILPQQIVTHNNNLTCTTKILPNIKFTTYNENSNNYITQENNFNMEQMDSNAYESPAISINMSEQSVPGLNSLYSNVPPCENMNFTTENLNYATNNAPNNPSGYADPGVVAVSNALFAYNDAFQCIPIKTTPKVFRKRVKGEANSEWSNAFVTKLDPCTCGDVEEHYEPYDVKKIYDEGKVKTVFNFDHGAFEI
ncbi:photosensitized INA-labeled protein PHIL1, putative [Hepatocystis sp. ex Piliocolobus tephrosceles]|nr:photosensitized INA-labeled protein PHIL1, putative [Hepatocystis sp. ex Piliocolobus tephrosceles]